MVDLPGNNGTGRTLGAHKANLFDISAASDRLWERQLVSSISMAPIATLLRIRKDTAMEQKYNTLLKMKDPMENLGTFNDVIESLPAVQSLGLTNQRIEVRWNGAQNVVKLSAKRG